MRDFTLTIIFFFFFLAAKGQFEIRFNLESSRFTGNGIMYDTLVAIPATDNFHLSPGLGLEYKWNRGKYDFRTGFMVQHFYNHIIVKLPGQTNYFYPYESSTLEFFRLVMPLGVNIDLPKLYVGLNILPSLRFGNGSIAMPNHPNDPFVKSQSRASLGFEGLIGKSISRRLKLTVYYKSYLTNTVERSDNLGTYNFKERGWGLSIFYRIFGKDQKSHNTGQAT